MLDIKDIKIRHTDTYNFSPQNLLQSNNNTTTHNASVVEAHFRDIESTLVSKIQSADAVVGCVAWLTSHPILDALASRKFGCSIVIQKEDFLRKDIGHTNNSNRTLRNKYSKLSSLHKYSYGEHQAKTNWLEEIDENATPLDISIRCVGFFNSQKKAIPRMHHKFLVFIRSGDSYFYPEAYAIWTGSFNMTKNAKLSLENGIYIEDTDLANAFFNEWHNTLMISEELDWTSNEPNPSIQYNRLDADKLP